MDWTDDSLHFLHVTNISTNVKTNWSPKRRRLCKYFTWSPFNSNLILVHGFKSTRDADQVQVFTVYLPYVQITCSVFTSGYPLFGDHWLVSFHHSFIPCRMVLTKFHKVSDLCRACLENPDPHPHFLQLFTRMYSGGPVICTVCSWYF